MARYRNRGGSLFSGLLLITMGALFLLHNYQGLRIGRLFAHWWPLFLILWGVIKLYERTSRQGPDGTGGWVTGREVLLVIGMLALIGLVSGIEFARDRFGQHILQMGGQDFSYDLSVPVQDVPTDAHITIKPGHGDVTLRGSDNPQIRISGNKSVHSWNESEARRAADATSLEIVRSGDHYEVRPQGSYSGEAQAGFDLDIAVPREAAVTIETDRGDVDVSDMQKDVTVNSGKGDVEIRDTTGDVNVGTRDGDTKVTDTKGNVKLSGRGSEVDVVNASGSLVLDGEFSGPIRAEKIAKGVRFTSSRTDLTISQLTGHMEAGIGNMEIVDAPGNLSLRTHDDDVLIENASGRVKVENRNAGIEVRFSSPPQDDVEISNASAAISLSLPSSSNFQIQADCHSCDIDSDFSGDGLASAKSNSGDSHLSGKYGASRGPKIVLKTSYGSINIHKTS